ncbi:copia-like retroelement pol polyprotein [Cucumis melo var. makuwa]|uniref:Copia-like retroelement pol polyprotein n=1 Tax=Cucumis melo var. makuwa TaxID=1194695 RepID=A0A5A7SY96_CUCMM|nr:copia-like retroelement pol polyprotein [Cucumis melo var. makuwa]TYK19736.1 copia-like retroelement pol polyprotein [Cucumis melo var. makuwa]
MDQSKSLEENLDEFQKIIVDLNNIGEKMSDRNQTVIPSNSLPETYQEGKEASSNKHAVEKRDEGEALLGDNGTYDVKGTGSIQIATHNGKGSDVSNDQLLLVSQTEAIDQSKFDLYSLNRRGL